MTDLEVLREARRLISEKGWTQCAFARDAVGEPVPPLAPEAQSYCLMGSLCAAGHVRVVDISPSAHDRVFGIVKIPLVSWNDAEGRTKEDVLRVLDEAIGGLS